MNKRALLHILWLFLALIGVSVVFFITRLINLTIIPIFTDEAIYLRWAQIALGDPRWRFISLIDGKQPLLIWLFLPALKLIADPLVAGRLVSIGAGFLGMVGLAVFSWYRTKSIKGAVVGGLLYILIPFFLMYDRLAVYDALLAGISVWSLFLSYLFAKKQRLDTALLLGTVIGAGLLTKSSANFFWYLLPVTLLLVPWTKKNHMQTLFKWGGLVAVVIIQSQIYNNILRLSEFRHIVNEKNLSFIYGFSEFIHNPFQNAYGNFIGLSTWLIGYLSIPLAVIIAIACIWYMHKNPREGLFFVSYFLGPFMALAFFGKIIYPRFILFMVPPLLIPTVFFALHIWKKFTNKWLFAATAGLIMLSAIILDMQILTDPIHAAIPLADRQQLINDWPAGYGIAEVITYLGEEAKQHPIIVGTEGTFGLFPMALELYLGTNRNVTFKPYWPLNEFPKELMEYAKQQPTFLLFKERQVIPEGQRWPIQLINKYQRGDGPTYLKFYRVLPSNE